MTIPYQPVEMAPIPERPILDQLESLDYILRPLNENDATERYANWVNDPEVNEFTQARYTPQTVNTVLEFIKSYDNRSRFLWGIFPKDEPSLHIGNHTLQVWWRHRTARLGIMIGDKSFWGRDVAQQTRTCVLDHAFNTLGLHKVLGGGLSTNFKNIYNYKKQGWTFEGTDKEAIILDGRRVDILNFSMFRDDWREKRGLPNLEPQA